MVDISKALCRIVGEHKTADAFLSKLKSDALGAIFLEINSIGMFLLFFPYSSYMNSTVVKQVLCQFKINKMK